MTQNCITVWDRHSACGTTGDENLRPYPCLSHPLASKQDLPGGPGAGRPVQDAAEEKQPRKFGSARATEKCAAPGLGACAQQRRTRIPAILLRSRSSNEGEGGGGDDRTQTTWSQKAAQQRDAPPTCKFHCVRSALGMWCASHMARCSLGARRRPRACQRKLS